MRCITAGIPNSSNAEEVTLPLFQGSLAGANLQAGISRRAMAAQLDLTRTHSQEADCRTCLGAASKGCCGTLSASKQKGEEESTTWPEAARRRPFPSARLWAKLITAGEQKELPLSPARSSVSMAQVRSAGAFSQIPFFGKKAIFLGNILDLGFFFSSFACYMSFFQTSPHTC